jgi:hypothetical protein
VRAAAAVATAAADDGGGAGAAVPLIRRSYPPLSKANTIHQCYIDDERIKGGNACQLAIKILDIV